MYPGKCALVFPREPTSWLAMPVAGATRTILPLNEERCESAANSFLCAGQKSVRCTCLWVRARDLAHFQRPRDTEHKPAACHGAVCVMFALAFSLRPAGVPIALAHRAAGEKLNSERRMTSPVQLLGLHRPLLSALSDSHAAPVRTVLFRGGR